MINYERRDEYIIVKWKKMQIGRIYKEPEGWTYKPRGCDGLVKSDHFKRLMDCKKYLEGKV
jgi:hypothetical protein